MKEDENTFSFLNVQRRLDPDHFDWAPRDTGKLWRYNLHYFDYLQEENRLFHNKSFLVGNWIDKVPKLSGDAWEPFPVSLRIVNWIKWFLSPETEGKIQDSWLQSLYAQALWLERNIEHHLLANHLFKNGKALLFAGLYFGDSNADRWLQKGIKIVLTELTEQILPDGGHFERSPMYHSMILEDCLDVLCMLGGWEAGRLGGWDAGKQRSEARGQKSVTAGGGKSKDGDQTNRETTTSIGRGTRDENRLYNLITALHTKTGKMVSFLLGMTHPDGGIALFNDAAFGIEAEPDRLLAYYKRVTGNAAGQDAAPVLSFPETGYYSLSPRPGDRMIIDCGPVGPDYQPGHSHCDTLSFELSLGGRRVVVDSGCCQYEDADIRRYNRGNAGHNTVTVDGENQSEVWGAHRCARRARPLGAMAEKKDGALVFEGSHDGYRRLSGRPTHCRKISWRGNDILIEDRLDGTGRHSVASRLHIHPEMRAEMKGASVLIHSAEGPVAAITANGPGPIETEDGWYCPEFGIKTPCKVLCLRYEAAKLPLRTGWRFEIFV